MSVKTTGIPPSSSDPCVLVAGAPQVGKSTLCQGITNAQGLPNDPYLPWIIQTKYYTATVEVREANAEVESAFAQPEALVLVFSLAAPSTFELARSFGAQFDLEAVEVKLLCGTHADALLRSSGGAASSLETSSEPGWFQQAADWSVENGFEFIICCPAEPSLDKALSLDGDRQGIARVVEALHAHAWPNLNMLPPGQQRPANPATHGADSRQTSAGSGTGMNASSCASGAVGNPPIAAVAPEQRQDVQEQRQLPDDEQEADPQQEAGPDEPESESAERMLDGLERLMAEMKEHKSRLAVLPDEERREQAAALALRMLEVLGVDDEGSGSDDE